MMTFDDYNAGVDLFRATGSLIVQPQMIVPVVTSRVLLWVPAPAMPELVVGVDPGFSQTTYPSEVFMRAIETTEPQPQLPEWYHPAMNSPVMREPYRSILAEGVRFFQQVEEELFGAASPPSAVPNLSQHTPADDDLVATLLDLARAGDAEMFRELALMRGVPATEIPAMWDGTVKRVAQKRV